MAELQLVATEKLDVVAIFSSPEGIDKILQDIKDKVQSFTPDTSTAKGRKEIASMAYKVAQSKTLLDGLGQQLVADWKDKSKKVDLSRKTARDFLDALKEEVREPLTKWEKDEAERIEKERLQKEYDESFYAAIIENDFFNRKRDLERREADLAQQERERVEKALAEAVEKERSEKEKREAQEAKERAEREAKEKDERERKEAEERAAREARIVLEVKEKAEREAQAKLERERQAAANKLAQEKAKNIAVAAEAKRKAVEAENKRIAELNAVEEKAKKEKEDAFRREQEAEQKRLADIKAAEEKAEREKQAIIQAQLEKERLAEEKDAEDARIESLRVADLAHRENVENEAVLSLMYEGIQQKDAELFIRLIVEGKAKNVVIKY